MNFYTTFKPVARLLNNGGVYLPNSGVIYPVYGKFMKYFIHFHLFSAVSNFLILGVAESIYLWRGGETPGLLKHYMILAYGTLAPSYIRVVYLQMKSHHVKLLIDMWEKYLANPPLREDRNFEIGLVKKNMEKIVKIQFFGFIIPLTIWSSRPVITKQEVIPTAFPGNHYETPTFEFITIFIGFTGYYVGSVWSGFECLQMTFMKLIIAELNHLHVAVDKIFNVGSDSDIKKSKPTWAQDVQTEEIANVRKILRTWVLHHQAVMRFSRKVNEIFGPMILLQNVCTIIFAFTSLFITVMGEIKYDSRVEAISYLIFYYYVLLKTCELGDEIQIKSKNVMEKFHGKPWFLYPKDIIKSVLIIQHVSMNRPMKMTASGFKDVSCQTFGLITQKGYEIITFMAHFVRRNRL